MPRWPSSLRARLTLWYTVLLGLPLIGFAVGSYLLFAGALQARTDRFIGDALAAFTRELSAERRTALGPDEAIRSTVEEVRFRDLHIAILDGGRTVAETALPDSEVSARLAGALRGRDPATPLALTLSGSRGHYRVNARPLVFGTRPLILTGTYSLSDIEAMLAQVRRMFLVAIPLLVLCAAIGGYVLAKRSFEPVASMAAQAAAIGASNLGERLPVGGGDELVGLAKVLNDLLDRLEGSFAQQQRFVADASHELRTPTAILRTEADITLSRDHRSEGDYRASMAVVQDAAGRLTRIVDDLFLLSRADAGQLVGQREPLYLEDVVDDAVRMMRSVAERRRVYIELIRLVEAPSQGDSDLLGRLLLNLLDNAIKYSPQGGAVEVGMSRSEDRCEIVVIDQGQGIPPEARERIFERFFRLDAARSRSDDSATSGAGLGLAIARHIAEMHGGRLELAESRPGRTELRLTLPVDRPPVGAPAGTHS